MPAVTPDDAAALRDCIAGGGVAVFPTDTVYGLGCDARDPGAVSRLYALKGRAESKPAAVLFFRLDDALQSLEELDRRTARAVGSLLPGPVTVLVPDPTGRFPGAGAGDPHTLGLRVPRLGPELAALEDVRRPILQSSANEAGGADPRTLTEVPPAIRAGADVVLDGGELPGRASTLVDLRRYGASGEWDVLREAAVSRSDIAAALDAARPRRPS